MNGCRCGSDLRKNELLPTDSRVCRLPQRPQQKGGRCPRLRLSTLGERYCISAGFSDPTLTSINARASESWHVIVLSTPFEFRNRSTLPALSSRRLPPGDKYQVILDNAEHSAFTERPLPGDSQPRNPNHHRVILALSTAFWDAYLKNNPEAKAWLAGDAPRSVMESADQWTKK